MNPETIRRQSFGCVRSVCGVLSAAGLLFAVSFTAHPADSSATNSITAARLNPPTEWKLIAEGGSDADLLIAPAAAPPENTNARPLRLTVRQRDGAVGLVQTAAAQTNLMAGQWYDLVFQATTQNGKHFAFTVSLDSD